MNPLRKLKSKLFKSVLRGIAVVALAASFVVPVSNGSSLAVGTNTPRFNFLKGDVEMLKAANVTRGQADYLDPVGGSYAGRAGDEIVFSFYFHNGMLNTVAHNTNLRVSIPQSIATQQRVNSYLDSDETPVITDTVVDNKIVGYGNGFAEINLTAPGRLEYVPGSTKMWRKSPNQWGVALPDGIASSSGLNIGSVNGCWEFAGYVTFKVKVKGDANIAIDKYVAFPGTSNWYSVLENAKEGDAVAFKIPVKNTGDTVAKNVIVKDLLPAKMTYIPGTTVYYGPDAGPNGIQLADGITGNGMYINELKPGDANIVYLVFRAKIGTGLNYDVNGRAELVNWASATYNGVEVKDCAKIIVNGTSGMIIEKTVWNGNAWVERNNAKLGDTITYRIIVTNIGQTKLTDIIVSDVIPVYTKYINGSTKVNGSSYADGINTTGLSLGNLEKGNQLVIEFKVLTYGCPPIGDYNLVNSAYALADQANVVSDTASTILSLIPVVSPSFTEL